MKPAGDRDLMGSTTIRHRWARMLTLALFLLLLGADGPGKPSPLDRLGKAQRERLLADRVVRNRAEREESD